jgi:hypothetical protein
MIVCISWNNKKCFGTVDVRYKHEDILLYQTATLVLLAAGDGFQRRVSECELTVCEM